MMGQVSKEISIALQVEEWDAIQTAIYKKECPPWKGIKKSWERSREIERESEHCKTKKCIPKKQLLLSQPEEGLK